MSGRLLLPAVLIAAIAIPYFAVREKDDNPLAAWWSSTWTQDGGPGGSRTAEGYPTTPTRLVTRRRLPLPEERYVPSTTNSLSPVLPPGASSTPTPPPDSSPAGSLTESPETNVARPEAASAPPSIGGPAVDSIADLLRFDINPQWVLDRWPRVSTQLAETDLQGLRVPWVSGTRIQDLTGSLTYYFDQQQKVQRLGFQGQTGDPSQLVSIMTQLYGLQAEPSLGGGMYVSRNEGQLTSILRIRYAPVIRSNDPRGSHEIRMELNRPDSSLSRQMQALLGAEQKARQWLPTADQSPATAAQVTPAPQAHSLDMTSGANDPMVGTAATNDGPDALQRLPQPASPSDPAASSPPAANSPAAPGPRWPYPGAKHDRGF